MSDDGTPEGDLDPMWAEPHEWWRRTELRDGSRVLVRQLRPEDRDRLAEGVRRLSPASRFLRFHRTIDELSDEELDYLTQVDHVDHEALVALDVDRPHRPGIGVARYIREVYEPAVAEAAITVADEYHGQGAGTILLGALAARARANGISVFRSYVLDGNHAMLEVFDHLGAHRERETDGLWRVDLEVPRDDEDVPRSAAGRAFVEAARGRRRLVSLLPPVWSRWRQRSGAGDPQDEGDDAVAEDDDGTTAPWTEALASELDDLHDELDGWLRSRDDR